WFIAWINGEPDFRVSDTEKLDRALRFDLCWLCGEATGRFRAFVIGPMCVVNRVTAEPPCHLDCAEYAVKACPLLTKPKMRGNEKGLAEMRDAKVTEQPAGIMLRRNPGVACIWVTNKYRVVPAKPKGFLFRLIGSPVNVTFWCEGRRATFSEVTESVDTGLPE